MKFMVVVHMVLVRYELDTFKCLLYLIFTGTYAGADGSRKPTSLELKIAEHQGSHFTQTATALKIGRAALPPKEASPPDPKQN
jgi:hypothetical protein